MSRVRLVPVLGLTLHLQKSDDARLSGFTVAFGHTQRFSSTDLYLTSALLTLLLVPASVQRYYVLQVFKDCVQRLYVLQVFKGIMNSSVAVAIKSVLNPTMRGKIEFVNEMAMLMNLRHQNVRDHFLASSPIA